MLPPKYKVIFSNVVKSLVTEEKNKYLAQASLDNLRQFLPEINDKNIDLLPIASSIFVANSVNLNGAVVDTKTAIETAGLFVNKPINKNHNRKLIAGVILTASFSEFGTEKPLTKDEASKLTKPFNVTVGGAIWRIADEDLADLLEDSNDPLSENYQKISSSFELGFDEFVIAVLPANSRNLEDAEIITDPSKISTLANQLKSFGGNGKTPEGQNLALLVKGNVLPLGIGLTTSPAADVTGVATPQDNKERENPTETAKAETEIIVIKDNVSLVEQSNDPVTDKSNNLTNLLEISQNQEKISHSENSDVKENKKIIITNMKINSLKDITDELLATKVITASSISDFVEKELQTFSQKWDKEKSEKENALKAATDNFENLKKTSELAAKELETVKDSLNKLQEAQAAKEKQETFNLRMAALDEKFELADEDRKILAAQIKDLDADGFTNFEKNMDVLLKTKNKAVIAAAKKNLVTIASVENPQTVVDNAVAGAVKTTVTVPVTSSAEATTLKEKYQKAFSADQFIVTL